MEINGISEDMLHAKLLRDYRISGSKIKSEYWQGRNRSQFALLSQSYGLKEINITVVFDGRTAEKVALHKSEFDAALWGKFEIYLPNGFTYTAILDDAGELEYMGDERGKAQYTLVGIQHKPLVTVTSIPFTCSSTVPFTDCIITATATATSGSIGDVDFAGVTIGDIITIDGIDKRLKVNGVDAATKFTWIDFPSLPRGVNNPTVSGVSGVTHQYFPTFL